MHSIKKPLCLTNVLYVSASAIYTLNFLIGFVFESIWF